MTDATATTYLAEAEDGSQVLVRIWSDRPEEAEVSQRPDNGSTWRPPITGVRVGS